MARDTADRLDATALKKVFATYRDLLEEHRNFLNRVNVYPVADADTGTNMLVTIRSALDAIDDADSLPDVATKLAHGAVMGGRGNSGIILSQIVKGMLEVVAGSSDFGPQEFAAGLERGRKLAYDAVADPVEGTILTAVVAAAAAIDTASNSLSEVANIARQAANDAVEATTAQLGQLARAGVVDGGAKGFALLLDSFAHVVLGSELPAPPPLPTTTWQEDAGAERWEVVLLLESDDIAARSVKEGWAALGSSIVIVSDGAVHKCHVHTDDYEKALEIARRAGHISDVAVTELLEETGAEPAGGRVAIAGDISPAVADLFASLDVGAEPSPITIALPGAAPGRADHVIEVASLPEALAAALAFDPDASDDGNAETMRTAAAAIETHRVGDLGAAREVLATAETAEVATVFVGPDLDVDDVTEKLQIAAPDIAIEVYPSGRSDPAIEIGLE